MIEVRGVESERAEEMGADSRSRYMILSDETIDLKAGDEIVLLVARPSQLKQEDYGIPLRLTGKAEPEEDEFIVQFKDKFFVAQKIPEFI